MTPTEDQYGSSINRINELASTGQDLGPMIVAIALLIIVGCAIFVLSMHVKNKKENEK